ncbi:universal stress protein [Streptomyces xanthii]|uniref:Universal stress protein n=1 Tax=Streptomyces xanthii TaxID=2768069 RepID=A0A7H1B0Q0_9ACTN|nr:universal stress protein [Streptomyces xanthii]QNS02305.1 universal stress protein [Streptomyces xanthii]
MENKVPEKAELGSIVAGVDGSPSAHAAALWAAEEAERRGCSLHLVHATDTDRRMLYTDADTIQDVREAGRDLLIELAEAVGAEHPGLTVTRELSRQEPVAALRAAAGGRGTVVVGNRGLGGFAALMLGSVGLGVAARAQGPVIVVRGDADRPHHASVTAAVHDAEDLDWLLLAAAEAEARKAVLRLVSVWNVFTHVGEVATMLDDLDGMAQKRVQALKDLADRVRETCPELVVAHHVEPGTSTPGILIQASEHTDLIVMGRGGRPLGVGPALGRVAHALIHHAHCPVQIVPHSTAHAEPTGGEST